ncbi:MAG TPA: cation:proton antiporter [Terriglobales bacterium]|jgi:CPA2 family monovalent cation:H+ antiporter-2|nr:cation:proton antiporter [Terriglobales bacterium]
MEGTFFRDLAYVFGAAVVGGGVARALRLPLILGYVLGGFLIGPFTPGPTLSGVHQFEELAEIGVILLMYSIGLEFSFRELLQVKWVAIFGGPLGILLSVGLGVAAGRLLGWTTPQGVAVGAIISVASTMVLSRLLADRGELRSPHGHVMIGITLVEDLAVVVLTVLLPSLNNLSGGHFLALGIAVGKALLILTPVMFVAAKLVPRLMKLMSRPGRDASGHDAPGQDKNEELYLLVVLALGFATAAITQAVGLSLALGAFLAGLIVSESGTTRKMLDKLLPLRDAFVALFFVTIGALVDPHILLSKPILWGAIVLLTMGGKFVIWSVVVWLFRYPWRTALLVGAGLTQIGEFSYVLVRVARDSHLVTDDVYHATLAASVITILLNGLLMRVLPKAAAEAV